MSDNHIPNILDDFRAIDNLPTSFNPETIKTYQPDLSYLDRQVQDNLKLVNPFEDRIKPITDRQDKTIKILEEEIDVYKIENGSLQ